MLCFHSQVLTTGSRTTPWRMRNHQLHFFFCCDYPVGTFAGGSFFGTCRSRWNSCDIGCHKSRVIQKLPEHRSNNRESYSGLGSWCEQTWGNWRGKAWRTTWCQANETFFFAGVFTENASGMAWGGEQFVSCNLLFISGTEKWCAAYFNRNENFSRIGAFDLQIMRLSQKQEDIFYWRF